MPKNVCNVLKLVLVGLPAVVVSHIHFAQSPSGKEAPPSFSTPTPQTNPYISTKRKVSSAQSLGLLAALFALPLTIAGYLLAKCRLMVHKFPHFLR